MNYKSDNFPLNHFALWAKGWYHKVHSILDDQNTKLFEELKSVLALDDYSTEFMTIRDFARVIINSFEDYNTWCMKNKLHYVKMSYFLDEIKRYENWGYGYFESIIMVVREFIQGSSRHNLRLSALIYSRELYKKYDLIMGDLSKNYKKGQTYKEMNKFVSTYCWS